MHVTERTWKWLGSMEFSCRPVMRNLSLLSKSLKKCTCSADHTAQECQAAVCRLLPLVHQPPKMNVVRQQVDPVLLRS